MAISYSLINYILWPVIGAFFLIYLFYYDDLKVILGFLINIIPLILLICASAVIYSKDNLIARKRKTKNEFEKIITLTPYDIYLARGLMFLTFAIIATLPFIFQKPFTVLDAIQGLIGFFAIFWIKMRYLKFRMSRIDNNNFDLDVTVVINYFDTMKLDLLSFGVAILIVFMPLIFYSNVNSLDIFQAILAFLSVYILNKKYFSFNN